MTENNKIEVMDNFISLWRSKGFEEDWLLTMGILAGSKEAVNKYGNIVDSFNELIKITKKHNDAQSVVTEFYDIISK